MVRIWRPIRVLLGLILRRPILGTSVIPILPNGQIVLARRRDTQLWSLPGGIVDWGEDIATAATRELYEETGLTVVQMVRLGGVYSTGYRDPRFHSVCVALEAFVEGHPRVTDSNEIVEVAAFDRDRVLTLPLSHDHTKHLQAYFANATVLA
ncbi:MAG: NUDIX domain-containing protein [Leptolyngbyaceae cyanobacterium]